MTKLTEVGEFGLHAWLRDSFSSAKGSLFGVGDDAALVEVPPGHDVLVSTDRVSLPNLIDQSGRYVGRFAALQNFSDIICKGGMPVGLLLAVSLQRSTNLEYFRDIVQGAADEAALYGAKLLGGDTKEHDSNTVVGVAFGIVAKGQAVSREGARPGDLVAVSLTQNWKIGWRWARHVVAHFGEAGLAESLLEQVKANYVSRSALPYRETLAAIATGAVTACMDMTDGLGDSLKIIGEQSGVGFLIDEESVISLVDPALQPIADHVHVPIVKFAWSPGFDWENLLTVQKHCFDEVRQCVRLAGGDLFPVGEVQEGCGIRIELKGGGQANLVPFSGSVFKSTPRQQQADVWSSHKDYAD